MVVDQFSSFEDLLAAYDEGVAEADSILGGLLQMLRATGLYDDALIIVTSDHGESFLDHDIWVGHGLFLTDDEVRVPLIVKLPDNQHAGTRVSGLASLVDIAPTILDVFGVEVPKSFQGQNLISPLSGEPSSLPRIATGFSNNTGARFLRTEEFKYISPATVVAKKIIRDVLKVGEGRTLPVTPRLREQLYDLSRDSQEAKSLTRSSGREGVDGQLKTFRAEFARKTMECGALKVEAQSEVPELDPEVKRQLEALGYVN